MSDSLRPHGLQHASFHCPLPTPGACSSSCPSSWWYHPTISSSAVPFSSCLQSFPASGSFPKGWLCIRWPNYWNFCFCINPSNEYSGLISFRINRFDLFAVWLGEWERELLQEDLLLFLPCPFPRPWLQAILPEVEARTVCAGAVGVNAFYLSATCFYFPNGVFWRTDVHADKALCLFCVLSHFSSVSLFKTLLTQAHQFPPSMGFSRPKYWSRLPMPSSGDLPNPRIEPTSPVSLALAGSSLPLE